MAESRLPAGWAFPGAAAKAHYFPEGEAISACHRWMHTGEREPETGIRSADDCAACVKRLPKPAGEAPRGGDDRG